jgi:hypothetical protein
MTKNNYPNSIGEDKITDLLRGFQPIPSDRFYKRMVSAPWLRTGIIKWFQKFPLKRSYAPFVLSLLFLFVFFGGIVFAPTIKTFANQIMYYFRQEAEDEIDVIVTVPPYDNPNTYGSPDFFSSSISTVEKMTGYPIKQIQSNRWGLTLSGAHFDPGSQAVFSHYQGDNFYLILSQREINTTGEIFSIGASADVESVIVQGELGEFVTGGWVIPSSDQTLQTEEPGAQVNINIYWDPNLNQSTLRWQVNGMAYEIRSSGENSPQKEELIAIAEQLQ